MIYFVKWKNLNDGVTGRFGREFWTPDSAAEYIGRGVLEDFENGNSGVYAYEIEEREEEE